MNEHGLGHFVFSFNGNNFSNWVIRIEIIPNLLETKSDGNFCTSIADWIRNCKRWKEDIEKENGNSSSFSLFYFLLIFGCLFIEFYNSIWSKSNSAIVLKSIFHCLMAKTVQPLTDASKQVLVAQYNNKNNWVLFLFIASFSICLTALLLMLVGFSLCFKFYINFPMNPFYFPLIEQLIV